MINLVRLHFAKYPAQRGAIGKIAVMQKQLVTVSLVIASKMFDAGPKEITRAANDAMNRVTFFEEELG